MVEEMHLKYSISDIRGLMSDLQGQMIDLPIQSKRVVDTRGQLCNPTWVLSIYL